MASQTTYLTHASGAGLDFFSPIPHSAIVAPHSSFLVPHSALRNRRSPLLLDTLAGETGLERDDAGRGFSAGRRRLPGLPGLLPIDYSAASKKGIVLEIRGSGGPVSVEQLSTH